MKTYKVTFDVSATTTHFGEDIPGIGVEKVREWLHSDTLFSAITHAYAKKYGFVATKELIAKFPTSAAVGKTTDIPFRCSSAYLASNDKWFVPRPRQPLPGPFDWYAESEFFKIKFITLENLQIWLGIKDFDWQNTSTCQNFLADLLADQNIYSKLFLKRVRAVNARDRRLNQTRVFHRGETIYSQGTQLYFLMDVQDQYEDELKQAIQFLVEFAGLGGEINVGFSHLKGVTYQPVTLPAAAKANKVYLLSLFPIDPDGDWHDAYYDIISRKGWLNSPFWGVQLKKKTVKMLAEGSCFQADSSFGYLLNVTPKLWQAQKEQMKENKWHPIYRYGIGYFLFF